MDTGNTKIVGALTFHRYYRLCIPTSLSLPSKYEKERDCGITETTRLFVVMREGQSTVGLIDWTTVDDLLGTGPGSILWYSK